MKLRYSASLVAGLSLVAAQTVTPIYSVLPSSSESLLETSFDETATAVPTAIFASATAIPSSEACLAVSSALATQSGSSFYVDAELAYECALSVPIVQEDALMLVDGIMAALEFQSDLKQLINPPADYPLAGTDLMGNMQQIRDQVSSGAFTSEIEFEYNVSAALGKAQDGHLNFQLDGLSVFAYARQHSLVSVSSDGKEGPELYVYADFVAHLEGTGPAPSVVTHVNGQEVVQYLQTQGQNVSYGGFQDPDALYNVELNQLSNNGNPFVGLYAQNPLYLGANTTLTFADGSESNLANYAIWNSNFPFTGLVDGESLYNICCNATAKLIELTGSSSMSGSTRDLMQKQSEQADNTDVRFFRHHVSNMAQEKQSKLEKRQTAASATVTQIPGYPTPVALSSDLSFSGYFLDDLPGFEDTAVMVMTIMSEADPADWVQTMTTFMDDCRNANKTKLVIDVQGNGGGTVGIAYAAFKMLFPDLWPYGAGTLRAQEGLDVLGTVYTNYTTQLYKEESDNFTLLHLNQYYSQFNPTSSQNDSGQLFTSWAEFYGPVDTGVDNYTNLIRWELNNSNYDVAQTGFVLPGFGNSTALGPSPFTSDNIILLSNGLCSSTCTIFSHFLKYQGKVKSIAIGGRPQTTAMQAIGGVKGSRVYYYALLAENVYQAHQAAQLLGYTDQVAAIENSKTLNNMLVNGTYIILRGANAGTAATTNDFGFNWQNNIAEEDTSYTPAQFVYEAADCHLWYQPQHIYSVSTLWATAAAQAFGSNGTDVFSLCVAGSTNAPSSLSGNATLFNNGVPTNVTDFQPEEFDTNGQTNGKGGHKNGVERLTVSGMMIAGAIASMMFML